LNEGRRQTEELERVRDKELVKQIETVSELRKEVDFCLSSISTLHELYG